MELGAQLRRSGESCLLRATPMSDRAAAKEGWRLNIGAFKRHYSAWQVESPDGIHLTARRKVNGRPRGPRVQGRSLDELARKIDDATP